MCSSYQLVLICYADNVTNLIIIGYLRRNLITVHYQKPVPFGMCAIVGMRYSEVGEHKNSCPIFRQVLCVSYFVIMKLSPAEWLRPKRFNTQAGCMFEWATATKPSCNIHAHTHARTHARTHTATCVHPIRMRVPEQV